jgi:signal transduction histidine kinase
MKRFLPKTLGGQLILVMLLAVAISQIVTLVIYRFERAKAVRSVIGEECLGRAVSAFRLAESTPPESRVETLEAVETPLTRYWITREDVASPQEWQRQAREHLLRPTSAIGRHNSTSSLFLNDPALEQFSKSDWQILPAGSWLVQQPIRLLDLASWNGFGFSMKLDSETWLNMVYSKPAVLMSTTLTPGYYTALTVTVLIFAFVAIFVARRISRPLRHLAKNAEELGRGQESTVMPEEGPDDIRSTIAAFNRMQVRLRRFLEDRSRMLAAIGHDLRTPITSLRLRTEFIPDPEMREKFTETLDEMQEMAEAALSYAQAESPGEATRVVEMNALLESICDDLRDLGWNVEFQSNGRLPYPCRPAALRRAVRNIIENAVRYGDEAKVALKPGSDGFEILVDDKGPGIPEADREKVFEPFVRLESSRNRDTGGVGLGLAIARSLVRNHGGEITLSQGPAGLRVHMHLPEAHSTPAIEGV